MYPVSNAFLTAVKANTRKYYWTGKITTTAGTVYNFDQEDMVKGSGYIWGQCCGSTEIKAYDYMVRFEKAFTSLEAIGNAYDFRLVLSQVELKSQVEQIILDMVADPKFKDYMVMKMDEKVDVSSLENERDQVREQLRQVVGAKKKLAEMLDRLDVNDKHYDRKYQDMHTIRNLTGEYIKIEPDCREGVRAQLERMKELCKERNNLYEKQNDLKGQKWKIEKPLER